jgi:TolA-binding protein
MTTQNIKVELNKDMETSQKRIKQKSGKKSPFSQTKNTVEDHSSRLEQMEDRISELNDKIEIKEKNKRNLRQTTQ